MKHCIAVWMVMTLFISPVLSILRIAHGKKAAPQVPAPKQPTGSHKGPKGKLDRCKNYDQEKVPCPNHNTEDNDLMEEFMAECLKTEQKNYYGYTCMFFPLLEIVVENQKTQYISCHHIEKPTFPCLHGFKLRPSRQLRKQRADDAYISVEFYGKVPPFPINGTVAHKNHDVAEWIAFSISTDRTMGDDLVLYCHPFMDREQFPWGLKDDPPKYPDDMGIGINKYYSPGNGKQAYDADTKYFGNVDGRIKNVKVEYFPPTKNGGKPAYGVLKCSAEISTFIKLVSKTELHTGVEIDMQKRKSATIFLGWGHCLHPECIGDHPNNTDELASISRRSTPLHKHSGIWFIPEHTEVLLFQTIDRDGSTSLSNYQAFTCMLVLALLNILKYLHEGVGNMLIIMK